MAPACDHARCLGGCSSVHMALQPTLRRLMCNHEAPQQAARQHSGARPTQREMLSASCTWPYSQVRYHRTHLVQSVCVLLLNRPMQRQTRDAAYDLACMEYQGSLFILACTIAWSLLEQNKL